MTRHAKPVPYTALSRFKAYDYRTYDRIKDEARSANFNRFSLIDTVLDGEYNDFEPVSQKNYGQVASTFTTWKQRASGLLFRSILYVLLVTYFVVHSRYKAV